MLNTRSNGADLYVAPLALGKVDSNASVYSGPHQEKIYYPYRRPAEMTPPETPNGSQENLAFEGEESLVFHNFLRAFYPFHPTYAMTDSSITLPLDEGDVVLIHSIHTNGWADGTLLASGARGWLPTNYCEAYEPPEMRNLLKSLLNFWDLLRSSSVNDREIFGNQEFMKGIIAGVRYLLQRTNCLNRESTVIQRSDVVRRCRKSLMSELSSLVKTAKRMQESQRGTLEPPEDVNDIVDEMILKALRIVTKGVRFIDTLEEDCAARIPAALTFMDTVAEESINPSTPPGETAPIEYHKHIQPTPGITIAQSPAETAEIAGMPAGSPDLAHAFPMPRNKRLSSLNGPSRSRSPAFSPRLSQGSMGHSHRTSSISHRVSLAGPAICLNPEKLASERLNLSHDAFLSHLGSFIGRLHLQSQSKPEVSLAIKQCAGTGGELLGVIDGVHAYHQHGNIPLSHARGALFDQIHVLVFAARDTLINASVEGADIIMPQDSHILLNSATGCVRTAGDCIAKTRAAIERVGDFEMELESTELGIDLTILDEALKERERKRSLAGQSDSGSVAESTYTAGSAIPGPRQLGGAIVDKPLPDVPEMDIAEDTISTASRTESQTGESESSFTSAASSRRHSLALPKLATALPPQSQASSGIESSEFHDHEYQSASRFDSLVASSAGSSATYLSRDSEASVTSQGSTRASTPENAQGPRAQPSMSELSASAGSCHTEEVDDVESRLMEKTFAHELMFNREGQVTGGTLPALVERLTTHETAPDAMFVSTFYLTFRLFTSPYKLAETLIDRFDYVGESPHMSSPVRLRVYNVFKGWLETHWRDQTDREALDIIIPFAEGKLTAALSSAGARLLELAHRVSSGAALVPRLVSSMGKTNTSIAQLVPVDAPVPQPTLSKSQQNLLAAWKTGAANCPSVLDFEPIELARQLTIKQMSIFCSILPEELLASQWMKNGGVDAPNVKAMSSLSTDISNLVADTVLQHSEIKKRAAVIKHWIKVANQCLVLNNYDGLMAIICSLNSSTISRLRKTWDILSTKRKAMLRTLQDLVEPSQNNKVLRTRLHDHVPPCLPFLGMYLTDLTFVDIGNPATKQMSLGAETDDNRASGMTVVNFDKHTRTAKIIGELQRFQIPYRLTEVPDLQDWFSNQIDRVREGDQGKIQVTYYRKSLLLEPRETIARTPTEPTPVISPVPSRTDLFGWMSRAN